MKIYRNVSLSVSFLLTSLALGVSSPAMAVPKVILFNIDGATPWLLDQYFADGSIGADKGLGLLKSKGYTALQNITCTPSLTASCNISIGTGSNTNNTNIPQNTFRLVRSPFSGANSTVSGFRGAPIGGYNAQTGEIGQSPAPTATSLWVPLLAAGKTVASATSSGADGLDIYLPGSNPPILLQPGSERTVNYTVPYGATVAQNPPTGYALTASDFTDASSTVIQQLMAAGISFQGTPKVATLNDNFTVGNRTDSFYLQAAAIATQTAGDYNTLVIFDKNQGIVAPGSLALPATGSAIINPTTQISSPFYLGQDNSNNLVGDRVYADGELLDETTYTNTSGIQEGTRFFVTQLAPDLSTVHIANSRVSFIPTNPNIADSVNDINTHVGTWGAEPDFSVLRGDPNNGFGQFSRSELEAIYNNQSKNFIQYQTDLALRAINANPNADLVLAYTNQPDASSHQFLLIDPRQASNTSDPSTILGGQDPATVQLYANYVKDAYLNVNDAIQRVIDQVGVDSNGVPKSNIIVTSDHGFEAFHTIVNLNRYLQDQGFASNQVRAVTSGAAAQIYINLQGREPAGAGQVTPEQYITLQQQVAAALQNFLDANPNYTNSGLSANNVIDKIYTRPVKIGDSNFGLETDSNIGQDFGDILGLASVGYNFCAAQNPFVARLGDDTNASRYFSVPSFYGAHGYDSNIPDLSAVFFAAGPDIGHGTLAQIRNIDIAPTISSILGVPPAATVDGRVLNITSTPEPGTVTGLGILGLGFLAFGKGKKRKGN